MKKKLKKKDQDRIFDQIVREVLRDQKQAGEREYDLNLTKAIEDHREEILEYINSPELRFRDFLTKKKRI